MTTETIDIRIREDGSRVVVRNLNDMGRSAGTANSALDLLKRTLGLLGGVLALDRLKDYADTWSKVEGAVRVATRSTNEQLAVQDQLFAVAQKTRAGLEGTVSLYASAARAGKELGASQQQIINFTEGVGKALAVQGVSATQASGALLQLGQLLGTGRVYAEEFNSILEQAPTILTVVANNIDKAGGSISKLKALVKDGQLTSKQFFDAFLKGSSSLDADFGKSAVTISQGLTLISNAFTKYIGQLNESTGIGRAFGETAKFIAANLSLIASAVGTLTAAYVTYFTLVQATRLAGVISAQLELVRAVASGRAVMLGSAQATTAKAAADAAGAATAAAAAQASGAAQTAANLATLRSAVALTEAKVADIAATQAGIAIAREDAISKLALANANIQAARTTIAAAEAAGALSFALATARAATLQLAAAEVARSAALTELAVLGTQQARVSALATDAIAAQARATAALSAAQLEGSAAAAAANARTTASATAAAAASTKAAQAGGVVARTLGALGLGALANPWILLATAIVAASVALYQFGDAFDLGTSGAATVLDLFRAIYQVGAEAFMELYNIVVGVFNDLAKVAGDYYEDLTGNSRTALASVAASYGGFYDDVGTGFAGLARGIAKTIDAIAGLLIGMGLAIVTAFMGLPGAISNIFRQVYNVIVDYMESSINVVIAGINKVRSFVGTGLLETVKLDRVNVNEKYFEQYGAVIADSIDNGFKDQGGVLVGSLNKLFDSADAIANRRLRDQFNASEKKFADLTTPMGKPGKAAGESAKGLDRMRSALRSLLDTILPSEGAFLQLEKAAKTLDDAVAHLGLSVEDADRYFQLAVEHYGDIIDPLGKINREINEQITLLGFNNREREVESQLLESQKQLKQVGITLDEKQNKALRDKYVEMQRLNELVQAQDALLAGSVERRRQFVTQLQAIQNLLKDPTSGFTTADANTAVVATAPELFKGTSNGVKAQLDAQKELYANIDLLRKDDLINDQTVTQIKREAQIKLRDELLSNNPDLFAGSQEMIDNQLQRFQAMYDQIQVLRDNDIISEQTAAQAKARVAIQQKQLELEFTTQFFGQLAGLQNSGNKKIAAIGKAAAITQATIDGVLAVQKALASFPPPYNYAMAAAVGVSAAANVAKIAGFEKGGYTGNADRKTVAGVVHGREFVVNADATSQYRALLERLNVGLPPLPMDSNIGMQGYEAGGYVTPIGQLPQPAPSPVMVSAPAAAPAAQVAPVVQLTSINVLDDSIVEEYLTGPKGEQVLVNFMQKNGDTIRSINRSNG